MALTKVSDSVLKGNSVAKAWVNFNGTGTIAIRGSFNVESITDNSTGNYTVNINNPMLNANYAVVSSSGGTNTNDDVCKTHTITVASVRIQCTEGSLASDADPVSVAVFGDQ